MITYMFSYNSQQEIFFKKPVMVSSLVSLLLCINTFLLSQSSTDATKLTPERPGARAAVPDIFPGKGLAQHNFLYSGEWDTRKDTQTIFLVRGGKVVWTW